MPRLRRRIARQRITFSERDRAFLSFGFYMCHPREDQRWRPWTNAESDEIPSDVLDTMREAWEHFRQEIMGDFAACYPGRRAWGWWRFDAPTLGPRPRALGDHFAEAEMLDQWGLLTGSELTWLSSQVDPPEHPIYGRPFRRPFLWWRFRSPERRDKTISEAQQLVGIGGVLTDRERHIIEHGCDLDMNTPQLANPAPTMPWLDLTNAERQFLRLPLCSEENDEE